MTEKVKLPVMHDEIPPEIDRDFLKRPRNPAWVRIPVKGVHGTEILTVGWTRKLGDDFVFVKHLKTGPHFLRSYPVAGIATDTISLLTLQEWGCKYVAIFNPETNKAFVVTLKTFIEQGIPFENEGHGHQTALAYPYWKITKTRCSQPDCSKLSISYDPRCPEHRPASVPVII